MGSKGHGGGFEQQMFGMMENMMGLMNNYMKGKGSWGCSGKGGSVGSMYGGNNGGSIYYRNSSSSGKSSGAPAPAGVEAICSVHGKKRTAANLMEDGYGGYCCIPSQACKSYAGAANGGVKDGDWLCPSCGDHQFARNT